MKDVLTAVLLFQVDIENHKYGLTQNQKERTQRFS